MLKKIISITLVIIFSLACYGYAFHVMANIELYSMTARKSLVEAVKSGDEDAIELYNRRYVDRGVEFF